MAKIVKLGVGIVTQGQIEAQTACSIISALPHVGSPFQMILAMGPYIHQNRENAVDEAFKNNCSHLLFIDTDIIFEPDAIKRLIDHDLDIVGGRYNKRFLPIQSTVPNITKLSETRFVPTGFLLINMEVFKKIGKPFFSFEDGAESEDVYFCDKAIRNGYKVWCDPAINIGHIGKTIY
jgi:GT2 family glycosyltransferase